MAVEFISEVTVGAGGASAINFSSIPQTYSDLFLSVYLRSTDPNPDTIIMQFSGDTSSMYNITRIFGYDGTVVANKQTNQPYLWAGGMPGSNQVVNGFCNGTFYIPNYTSSYDKSIICDTYSPQDNTNNYRLIITSGLWRASQSVSSINLRSYNSGNFVQNSKVTLYGIKKF